MPIQKDQIRNLISETLKELDLYSDSAVELIMMTFAAESNLGEYLSQTNGPAIGIGQCEPSTHDDIMYRWLPSKPALLDRVTDFIIEHVGSSYDSATLEYNLKYAILITRLHYLRFKAPLPESTDIEGLAAYYKKYYNTYLGKGTVSGAVKKYKLYC